MHHPTDRIAHTMGLLHQSWSTGWNEKKKEGNVLFNKALNTFYLQLFGIRHMVKDHSNSEKGNPLPSLYRLLFPISSKGMFYMHHPTDRIVHTMAFVMAVVEHWLEQEIVQCVSIGIITLLILIKSMEVY